MDQKQIQEYLEGPPHYALDLVGSIVENGFLPYEPLIVRQHGDTYIVIEGNRRLAAVQSILRNRDKYPPDKSERLNQIPVLIFAGGTEESTAEEIERYLGVKHLFGFRDWPPESKAIFLDKRVRSKKDLDEALKELNIKRGEAARYLIPYRLTKAAKEIFQRINKEDFWSLAESFGRSKIRGYIQLDVDRRTLRIKYFDHAKLRHLASFLYGKRRRITDTRQLSNLSKALGSPEASKRLEKGSGLDEALLYVETKTDTISNLLKQLERVLEKMMILSPNKEECGRIASKLEEHLKKFKK
jgi:hypothetical protein